MEKIRKWFIAEEAKREEAVSILDEIQQSPHLFAVPELFFKEMFSVLCRLISDVGQIRRYLHILESLGLYRLGNGSELLSTAAHIAVKYKLTGYDAIYAASAKLIDGEWITADIKAHKRIGASKSRQHCSYPQRISRYQTNCDKNVEAGIITG